MSHSHRFPLSACLEQLESRVALANLLDPSFGGGDGWVSFNYPSIVTHGGAVVRLDDGKYIAVGNTVTFGDGDDFYIARLENDGSFDTSFGTNGYVRSHVGGQDHATTVLIQSTGKIVVVGSVSMAGKVSNNVGLARYDGTDGSLDTTFGAGGFVVTDFGGSETGMDAVLQGDSIIVVGESSTPDYFFTAWRYTADGVLDTTFGNNGDGRALANTGPNVEQARKVALQTDGKFLVGGYSNNQVHVARFDANGKLDLSFGGGDGIASSSNPNLQSTDGQAMLLQADGKILIGGGGTNLGGTSSDLSLIRFDENGILDPTFDGDGRMSIGLGSDESIADFAQQANGKIVLTGPFGHKTYLIRLNLDGSFDSTLEGTGIWSMDFLPGQVDEFYWLLQQPDATLVASGVFGGGIGVARFMLDPPQPPVAEAGGPYSVNEGNSVQLDASGSSDAEDPDSDLIFEWDLDDDGLFGETGNDAVFGDELGMNPTFSAANLDGKQARTVRVRVTDTDGMTDEDVADLTVNNAAPTAGVSGPTSALRGEIRSFTFSATDPSPADLADGFEYAVNWGDGQSQTIPRAPGNGAGVSLDHTYSTVGALTITVTALDADGGKSKVASHGIDVSPVRVQAGLMEVFGTPGNDRIVVSRRTGGIGVTVDSLTFGPWTGVSRIIVYADAGNDIVQTVVSSTIAVELYGGSGHDWLRAGLSPSVLDGGDGNDWLFGGMGRDLLIGGLGADVMSGGFGDDIEIGGTFMNGESLAARRAAFDQIMTAWLAPTSYAARTTALESFIVTRSAADSSRDLFVGGRGRDWFFGSFASGVADLLVDRRPGESIVNLA